MDRRGDIGDDAIVSVGVNTVGSIAIWDMWIGSEYTNGSVHFRCTKETLLRILADAIAQIAALDRAHTADVETQSDNKEGSV